MYEFIRIWIEVNLAHSRSLLYVYKMYTYYIRCTYINTHHRHSTNAMYIVKCEYGIILYTQYKWAIAAQERWHLSRIIDVFFISFVRLFHLSVLFLSTFYFFRFWFALMKWVKAAAAPIKRGCEKRKKHNENEKKSKCFSIHENKSVFWLWGVWEFFLRFVVDVGVKIQENRRWVNTMRNKVIYSDHSGLFFFSFSFLHLTFLTLSLVGWSLLLSWL